MLPPLPPTRRQMLGLMSSMEEVIATLLIAA